MKRTGLPAMCALIVALLLLGAAGPAAALDVGDKVPDFTLPATTQDAVSMHDFQGKKNVVLFGFVGAFTPT